MKKIFGPVILLLMVFMTLQCCTGRGQRSRRPVSSVTMVPAAKNYLIGQPVEINVDTRVHDGSLKEVNLFINNTLVKTSDQLNFSYKIEELGYLGQNTIRVVAEKKDGVSNTRLHNFTVLSDIVPVRYEWTIVREHPHSTEHFTQGLEFHDGYLYEGTGEHGKSGIYKINHQTGHILQSAMMDDKYFGEGITILNNKLYQLTYKTQIGFVYSLSDFAVIDSFKYESKEGWGLTNDGKHLIMSDGTGTLTWLDPDDFSVFRRVQVADNQRAWEYINELEYVNGSIWANVWTTNQIIRMDAETGKILGYIDLDGILSIMHQSQLERIDVLNGIAYNPANGNYYITGKLWPKLFEINIEY